MKKILWTGLVAGGAMALVNMGLNFVMNAFMPQLQEAYMGNPVFRPWDDPIMMLFFLYPLVLGLALAYVWDKTKKLFTAKLPCKRGFDFAMIYFFVVVIPMFLINFSSFNLPFSMIMSWTIMSLINGLVAGIILARLNK